MVDVNDYEKQIDKIEYKNEIYSARDNGAVLRHPKNPNKPRPVDNIWTFGKQNSKTGYMEISGQRVHRIVATGFLGNAPSKEHLVDHIDTNRANNRPDNLRWVTKLENILLNPATCKRIAYVCGSVENFLADPAKYRDQLKEPNLAWMCTVTAEEAQNCKKHLEEWNKIDNYQNKGGKIGKWIFTPPKPHYNYTNYNNNFEINDEKEEINSNYNNQLADQDWSTPTIFFCLPESITETPLQDYYNKLKEGTIFGKNRYAEYKIYKCVLCEDCIVLMTLDEEGIKPWCVMKITFDTKFHHSIIKTCFDPNGAEKQFFLAQGLEWNGPDSIDDYC